MCENDSIIHVANCKHTCNYLQSEINHANSFEHGMKCHQFKFRIPFILYFKMELYILSCEKKPQNRLVFTATFVLRSTIV